MRTPDGQGRGDLSGMAMTSGTSGVPASPGIPGLDLPSLRKKAAHPPRARVLVFIDPVGAFVATLKRPMLALMLVVACACAVAPAVAFVVSAQRQGGITAVVAGQMEKSGALDRLKQKNVDKDGQAAAIARAGKAVAIFAPVGAVVQRLGLLLLVAAACFFGLRGTRKTLRFSAVLAVVVVGAAPLYVHDLLAAVALMALDAGTIDTKNVVASNLAAIFFVDDNRSIAAIVLQSLDVFSLWALWLMGAGVVHAAGGRTTWPWVVTFGLHLTMTLLAIARS